MIIGLSALLNGCVSGAASGNGNQANSLTQDGSVSQVYFDSFGTIPNVRTNSDYMTGEKRFISYAESSAKAACIADRATGLLWIRDPKLVESIVKYNFANQMSMTTFLNGNYLYKLNTARVCGVGNWRVPAINELATLLNYGESSIAGWLESNGFKSLTKGVTAKDFYWSSNTSTEDGVTKNYDLNFGNGGYLGLIERGDSSLRFLFVSRGK